MKQVSAIERLKGLPPVFRGSDLTMRFQWTSKTASHYLYLWKRRSLVAPLGGHSDVYVNTLKVEHPDWERALLTAMPSAVVVGIEALRRAGWTTQIPTRPTVAVASDQPVYSTHPFQISARPAAWFAATRPGIACDLPREAASVLAPAWALADLLRQSEWGSFGLWPDDIEWDQVTAKDHATWSQATAAFGMPATPIIPGGAA
jgi:hypothetical protein